eukprot:TRINITY_DN1643_c0_g1_i4.p1 TRINITY_DN1643_c0_g1~~TRINITY_DN1643_c0_g1_i4.p1  ORF type:complete len:749 (-),score=103.18 TRINITY_DN1643_c0_g1_i4:740-2857(-)
MNEKENSKSFGIKNWAPRQRSSARCVSWLNSFTLLFGITLIATGLYARNQSDMEGEIMEVLTSASIVIGCFIMMLSFCGCCGVLLNNRKMLLMYYILNVFMMLSLMILSGLCFLMKSQVTEYIDEHWDELGTIDTEGKSELEIQNEIEDQKDVVINNMRIIGSCCGLLVLIMLFMLSRVSRLVSARRAASTLLLVMNSIALPIGAFVLVCAMYVAQVATTISAPKTAFYIFLIGMFIVMLNLLGCFGTAVESRGMLRLFIYLIFVAMAALFAFGILVFANGDTMKETAMNNWEEIREIFPPTFSGKYDKNQFQIWLDDNIKALGFLSLIMGTYTFFQWRAGMVLRRELSIGNFKDAFRLFDSDGDGIIDAKELHEIFTANEEDVDLSECKRLIADVHFMNEDDEGDELDDHSDKLRFGEFVKLMKLRKQDAEELEEMQAYEGEFIGHVPKAKKLDLAKGHRSKRRCVKPCFCFILVVVIIIILLTTAAVFYTQKCDSFSSFKEIQDFALEPNVSVTKVEILNHFTRGKIMIDQRNNTDTLCVNWRKTCITDGFLQKGFPVFNSSPTDGTFSLVANPIGKKKIFAFDISCALSDLTFHMPASFHSKDISLEFTADSTYGEIDLRQEQPFEIVPATFKGVSLTSTKGPISISDLALLEDGIHANSDNGDILIEKVSIDVPALLIGTPKAALTANTGLGLVTVTDVTV